MVQTFLLAYFNLFCNDHLSTQAKATKAHPNVNPKQVLDSGQLMNNWRMEYSKSYFFIVKSDKIWSVVYMYGEISFMLW